MDFYVYSVDVKQWLIPVGNLLVSEPVMKIVKSWDTVVRGAPINYTHTRARARTRSGAHEKKIHRSPVLFAIYLSGVCTYIVYTYTMLLFFFFFFYRLLFRFSVSCIILYSCYIIYADDVRVFYSRPRIGRYYIIFIIPILVSNIITVRPDFFAPHNTPSVVRPRANHQPSHDDRLV